MANYNQKQGMQSILDAALGDYSHQGFRLYEPDDHILQLSYGDRQIAIFGQTAAEIPAIRGECQRFLDGQAS